MDTGTGNALQTILDRNNSGKTVYNGSFYGGTSVDHLDQFNDVISRINYSGATIVYLSTGGNDLLAGKLGGGMYLGHPDQEGLSAEVIGRIGQLVAARQLPYVYHSDGRIYEVIDDLLECGFHALHPCEPASMDILELKRKYGGRLCLCGSVDLDRTLTLGSPTDVEAEVISRLRAVAPGGGFCCGASNSVPEYVPYDNYLALINTVKKYGGYPVRL